MRNRIPCQRDAGTRLAMALCRHPFSACNKGNRRRLHAGKQTTITGNNWMKVNYIWVLCLRLFFIYRSIFPVSQGQRYIHKMCTGADQKTRPEKIAKWQKRYWTRVVQTKAHFFRFLEVNIRLCIEANICLFQVLMQLYSDLLLLSAPYNFLHSRCLYKVSSLTWHVDVDRNR